MRRPRLHSIFHLNNREGLSTILSSDFTEDQVKKLIIEHESGLHIMTSGALPPNPAELIGSDQMQKLLKMLQPHYSQIVIDSPPIGSFTDDMMVIGRRGGHAADRRCSVPRPSPAPIGGVGTRAPRSGA